MNTRNRPNGHAWPGPSPLSNEPKFDVHAIKKILYTSKLSAEEVLHLEACQHHFGTVSSRAWEHTAWSQHGRRKHHHSLRARCAATLRCGYRCGRPFVRTDIRDQQWFCGGHDPLLPRRSRFLELPAEIRNEIYKYAFPPFLGLFPERHLQGSSIGLLEVNKQVQKEVVSLMCGTRPLRLRFGEEDLSLDESFYDWGGRTHDVGRYKGWLENQFVLVRFFGGIAFRYVKDVEIRVDLFDSENGQRSILLDFIDALARGRRTQLRCLTIKFTAETLTDMEEEVQFFRFLQVFRDVPEFRNLHFKVEPSIPCWSEVGEEELLRWAFAMRDSMLFGRKRKLEQFQE